MTRSGRLAAGGAVASILFALALVGALAYAEVTAASRTATPLPRLFIQDPARTPTAVRAFAEDLARGDRAAAYRLTDIALAHTGDPGDALSYPSFDAYLGSASRFEVGSPASLRGSTVVDLILSDTRGTLATLRLATDGGVVRLGVATLDVCVTNGPPPALEVDGVPVHASADTDGSACLGTRSRLRVIRGPHAVRVPDGPFTAATSAMTSNLAGSVQLFMEPNSAATTRARQLAAAWLARCGAQCAVSWCDAPSFVSRFDGRGAADRAQVLTFSVIDAPPGVVAPPGGWLADVIVDVHFFVQYSPDGTARLAAVCA